ncbi:MAG: CPBP family intramembrane metalloprotease [Lachnospiraceae bacterium]|nr:CPBP family intramembrane metalloprotease [Lachnospiraceae bacterium]
MSQSAKLSITYLATVILMIAVSSLLDMLPEGVELPFFVSSMLSQLIILLPSMVFVKANRKDIYRMVPHKNLSAASILCLLGLIAAIEPLIAFANYVSSLLFGNAVEAMSEDLFSVSTAANVLLVAVIPAFSEELVFRGIYYNGYRKHGFWKAMLISGLFFGLLHMNWNQFSYGFILGLVLAVVMEATESIYAPMLFHFGINFQSVMMLASYESVEEYNAVLKSGNEMLYGAGAGMALIQSCILFLAAAVSVGICLLLIYALARLNHRTDYMSWIIGAGERQQLRLMHREKLFSLPMAAAILICVGFMCLFQIG